MSHLIAVISHWLKRVITQPREELDRWQRAVRFAYDLGRFGARQLQHDRAQEMAAAMAFRTLFGLLPVLVVATVLVKATGFEQHYMTPLDQLLSSWQLDEVHIVPPTGLRGEPVTLATWLHERVAEAEKVNFAAIGWVGVVVTLYAAIGLLGEIENAFNLIYRASQGRRWANRVPIYWFILTVSPVAIILNNYVDTWFQGVLAGLNTYGWLSTAIGWTWSVLTIWLLMFSVYMLFPNTSVHVRPAAVGALVAAVLLEIGKRTMGMYLNNALSLSQLYGSLGLIPLFMFWVYLMWLAVLFGLQVSSTLQHLHGRQLAELEQKRLEPALVDPMAVIVMVQGIAQRFVAGGAADVDDLARRANVPAPVAAEIIKALVAERLVHRLANGAGSVALGCPPDQIPIEQLVAIAHRLVELDVDDRSIADLLNALRKSQRDAAASITLANLMGR
jgi:membrane protein